MLRHTLILFVKNLTQKYSGFNFKPALKYLQNKEFHKRIRDEITMIPIPKLKPKKSSCPVGIKFRDYKDRVIDEQKHVLEWAIDRVRNYHMTGKITII